MFDVSDSQDKEHAQSVTPFHLLNLTNSQVFKVWDFWMPAEKEISSPYEFGRVRLLAVWPRMPAPLENIKFSVAWCNPQDTKFFSKRKSNQILIGRFLKTFEEGRPSVNCGIVDKVNTIKEFPMKAINSLPFVPKWAGGFPPDWDYLASKKMDIQQGFLVKSGPKFSEQSNRITVPVAVVEEFSSKTNKFFKDYQE